MNALMQLWSWILDHLPEILTVGGSGAGGGFLGKRMVDKEQSRKIAALEIAVKKNSDSVIRIDKSINDQVLKNTESIMEMKKSISENQLALDNNTAFDKHIYGELQSYQEKIDKRFDRLEEQQTSFMDKLFELVSNQNK